MLVAGGGKSQENDGRLVGVLEGVGRSEGEVLVVSEATVLAVESQEKEESLGSPHANLGVTGVWVRVGGIESTVLKTGGGASQEKDELLGRVDVNNPVFWTCMWEGLAVDLFFFAGGASDGGSFLGFRSRFPSGRTVSPPEPRRVCWG